MADVAGSRSLITHESETESKRNCMLTKSLIIAGLCWAGAVWYGQAQSTSIDPATGLPIIDNTAQTNLNPDILKAGPFWRKINLNITFKNIVDAALAKDDSAEAGRMFFGKFYEQKFQTIGELGLILCDTNATELSRGTAALYLGEMHDPGAAEPLARNITLNVDKVLGTYIFGGLPHIWHFEAQRALVKIGLPAIPPVIRNLAESDDKLTRDLSLQTLCEIEKDKDIVRLRLQKALEKEPDKTKQTRLQTALTALDTVKF